MKASVDKSTCLGCGVCVDVCPDVFELDEEGMAKSKVDEVPAEAESACRDAAEQCPDSAIQIEE